MINFAGNFHDIPADVDPPQTGKRIPTDIKSEQVDPLSKDFRLEESG
jgi:hypothetical protein